MDKFVMNGIEWDVKYVYPDSHYLVDRTGERRVATTDPLTHCVYLSNELAGDFLNTVLIHELGHCIMFSYNLLDRIHSVVSPIYWIDAEEWVCNFIADYGKIIFTIARRVLGDQAMYYLPRELEKIVA